jgi:hypothetical protein
LIGELPELYESTKDMSEKEERWTWLKAVVRGAIMQKQKDAAALQWLAMQDVQEPEHDELIMACDWFDVLRKKEDPSYVADRLHETMDGVIDFTDYEKAAFDLLRKRAGMGGMMVDRRTAIAAMILIYFRRLNPNDIEAGMDFGTKRLGDQKKLKTSELPWYAFDKHTQLGKIALANIAKKNKVDPDVLWQVWFHCESAYVPNDLCKWSKVKELPDVWESMWWPVMLKKVLAVNDKTPRENNAWWFSEMQDKARGAVEWLIDKRDN